MHDHSLSNKIVLGSVQFGMHYGISNDLGSPDNNELKAILKTAEHWGIRSIDTAAAYGNAEERLGKSAGAKFEFISKLKPGIKSGELSSAIDESLKKLQVESLSGLMFHSFDDYQQNKAIWSDLESLRESGKLKAIGFSLYEPKQLHLAIKAGNVPDIIQVPFNLYDKRFESVIDLIEKYNIELHTRSVFLQGLMFLKADELSGHFKSIQNKHQRFHELREELGLSVIGACLGFALSKPWIDQVVVGVNSEPELIELIEEIDKLDFTKLEAFDFMREDEEKIINPSLWKT